ncbi:MAG: TonB family protein [Gammaproteobacteria bacterium]
MNRAATSGMAGERLAWAIFVAAAAHGLLILGVGFAPPDSGGPDEVPTLEVTLLDTPVPDQAAPVDAQYLAQASQEGAGNVAEPLPPEFFDAPPAPKDTPDTDARDHEPERERTPPAHDTPAAEMVASWQAPLRATIAPREPEVDVRPAGSPPDGGETRVTAAEEREYFVSVSARESVFAEYLAAWKARMERLGTLNYPAAADGWRGGNPVLEVAVTADGRLREVRLTQSSGHSALDQAAIDLVRLGSPYDAFPPAVRAQHDVLRFAYEWRFLAGRAGPGELRAAPQ